MVQGNALRVPRSVPRRPGSQVGEQPAHAPAPSAPSSVDARMAAPHPEPARPSRPAPSADDAAARASGSVPPLPSADDRPASAAPPARTATPPRTPPTPPATDALRRWPASEPGDAGRAVPVDEAAFRLRAQPLSAGRRDRRLLLSAARARSDEPEPPPRAERAAASAAADARLSFLASLPRAPAGSSPPDSPARPPLAAAPLRRDALVPLAQRLAAYRASGGGAAAAARAEAARGPCARAMGVARAYASSSVGLDARLRLWAAPIRSVQGQFGSGIGDFFELWRDVVFLDSLAALLWLALVVAPCALSAREARRGGGSGGASASASGGEEGEARHGVAERFGLRLYGGYPRWAGAYDLGEAYTLAALGTFALILWGTLRIMLANLIARADSEAQPGGGGGCCGGAAAAAESDATPFAAELFCAVDWKCTDGEAVRVGVRTALLALSERLYAERLRARRREASLGERARAAAKHALGGAVSAALVSGYLVALWYACDKEVALRMRAVSEFSTPALLAALKLAAPLAVRFVIRLEGYADEGEVTKQICVRVYALKMANLAVALYGVHDALHLSACPNATSGEFLLRLYATDLAASLLSAWLSSALAARAAGGARLDYDISAPTVDLFYRQEMALLGVYTCPPILCAFVLGEALHFGATIALLRRYYKRPLRPFALAQGEHFFHSLSALTTAIGLAGTVWMMRQPPLGGCGPHEEHIPLQITLDALRARREPLIDRALGALCAPTTYAALALVLAARLAFRAATAARLAAEVSSLQAELRAEKATLRALIVEQQLELR